MDNRADGDTDEDIRIESELPDSETPLKIELCDPEFWNNFGELLDEDSFFKPTK